MYDSMKGRVALVTGAASGMGRASSLAFAREGAKVVLADWAEDGGRETEAMITSGGGEALFVKTDVSQSSDVDRLFDQALERFGALHYAHNNADVGGPNATLEEITEADWDSVISINLKGIWLCMKRELAYMKDHDGGAIVNTASNVGVIAILNAGAYVAAKHGVIGITKAAALEFATEGVRINCVCPGVIDTPMVDAALQDNDVIRQWMLNLIPMKRMGTAEEVAEAVLWLCSDASSFVNGHPLVIDAGQIWVP
jgi:NAD(P)-dependent dehydrogenase (short-subunit alcohol dehydrogenase family)